jgi:hypothetical protein
MTYTKIYKRIVDRAKERELDVYTEMHHVIPRCMGGTEDPDNIVKLTPEEHYICHLLLAKEHPDHEGLALAAIMMGKKRNNKAYGWLKRNLSESKKKPKAEYTCKHCGKVNYTTPCHANKQFCNRACRTAYLTDDLIDKVCECCGKDYKVKVFWQEKSRYCSRPCYYKGRFTGGVIIANLNEAG